MSESVTQKKINILSERSKKNAKWDKRKILKKNCLGTHVGRDLWYNLSIK